MKKKLGRDRFLNGVDRSMTAKEDDYRRLAGDAAPLRVLFLDMDGVMISRTAQRDLGRHTDDRARYGHAVTPDRSARIALDLLLRLTDAKVCLATSWAWHVFDDGTPGLDLAIEKLKIDPTQWLDRKSVYEPARHREKFVARVGREPEHQDKAVFVHNTLATVVYDRTIAGWAFLDDDFGDVLFDKMKGRGIVKVDRNIGLDIPTVLEAARVMRVEIREEKLEMIEDARRQWRALRDEDGLWAYDMEFRS